MSTTMTRPAALARLPVGPGVYRFRDSRERVLYIGRATDVRRRVTSYWGTLGDRHWLRPMVRQIARVEAVSCDSEHEAAWLERNLLELERPRWNRAIGGQEVPVVVRLDPRPSSPSVTVVHEPTSSDGACYFGPYLGGTKIRLAVSALGRLLPVTYTSERLSGFGQDMARVLGVARSDREALVGALGAVLERDPAAVGRLRSEWERRRDEAAQALAFERAAQLHAEMGAIDWLVAEQKVAMLEPLSLDVHGWAEGVLASFAIRAGRLCEWQQRRCSEDDALRHVAATPAAYAGFARRNAELAARLTT